MDDVPWLYVAMIFIAFISWVSNRIKEANEYRRARRIEKEKAARARRTTAAPEFQSPYREQASTQAVEEEETTPKSFREVFQELERQFTEPAEEEVSYERPSPPPLPADEPFPTPAFVPTGPVKVAPPMATKKRRSRNTSDSLIKTLRNGENLKTALILKEVLDKPKALRQR